MSYVYIIKSIKKKWYYIGSTKDLKLRLQNHNLGKSFSTKPYRPLKLIYYEAYSTYHLARKREFQLKKNGQQKELLFERLELV